MAKIQLLPLLGPPGAGDLPRGEVPPPRAGRGLLDLLGEEKWGDLAGGGLRLGDGTGGTKGDYTTRRPGSPWEGRREERKPRGVGPLPEEMARGLFRDL